MDYRVGDAVRAATGLETVLLEPLGLTSFVVELLGPATPVTGFRWVDRSEHPVFGACYGDWLARSAGGVPDPRPPWFKPGWYERASDELARVVAKHGLVQRGQVRQVKQWSMSSVLCVETSGGRLFLKAVTAELAHGPHVVRWLGGSFAAVGCPLLDLGAWLDEAGEAVAESDVGRYLGHWVPWLAPTQA